MLRRQKQCLHVARWVWSLKEASCVWFCWLQSSKLQLIIGWSAWLEALLSSTCKLFWALKLTTFCPENVLKTKEFSAAERMSSKITTWNHCTGIQLLAGWALCLDRSDNDTCLGQLKLGQSQLVWCISRELLLVFESLTMRASLSTKTILIYRAPQSNQQTKLHKNSSR